MDFQDISSNEMTNNKLVQVHKKESPESFLLQKKERLLRTSNELPCCSTTRSGADFTGSIFDSDGLFIPWELYVCIGFDLLRPLAKLQALKNMNLYYAIRNELCRRGKNGGLRMLNIAREITVSSYFREIRTLWNSRSNAGENDFDFVFIRIISFLHWANANISSLTDLGPLNVEKLMLCYNCRWGETSTARKRFDSFMRQILFDMKDLLAVRSWCGILREKTVVDIAMVRAEYLMVVDLGTMMPKGPFKKWNLKDLFLKLKNLEDFTWLNCDIRTLVYLTSVSSLRRLVLHVTKYDQVFFEQFFARFGFDTDVGLREPENNEEVKQEVPALALQCPIHDDYSGPDSFSNIFSSQDKTQESLSTSLAQSALANLDQAEETGSQAWISVKSPPKKVHLDYAALSFAYAILHSKEHDLRNCSSKVPVKRYRSEKFHVPLAVLAANTVILNLPPASYERNFLNMGISKKKFGIGFPKEICANIKPNRTSYGSIVQVLETSSYEAIGRGTYAEEVEIHVMFDHYRKERVVHLFNLAMVKFFPKILRLHFTAAGRSVRRYYRWPHSISDSTLFLRYLTVFELTLNCLTFSVPKLVSYSSTPDLEEVYITLCGLPHNERGTIQNIMELFRFFMQPKDDLRIVIFRINAPYFFAFLEVLSLVTAENRPVHLETLGIVCCVPETKMLNLSSRIYNAIKSCSLEAELAPDDCKDLKYHLIYESDALRHREVYNVCCTSDSESEGSESPALDNGNEYLMKSDYSDTTGETAEDRTFAEILASKLKKKDISRRRNKSINRSQSSSGQETGSNTVEHLSRKKRRYRPQKKKHSLRSNGKKSSERIPLQKQNNASKSTDEE
ncbi:hypothetical protein ACH3XW_5635 [Acanthocheilonema viteae]